MRDRLREGQCNYIAVRVLPAQHLSILPHDTGQLIAAMYWPIYCPIAGFNLRNIALLPDFLKFAPAPVIHFSWQNYCSIHCSILIVYWCLYFPYVICSLHYYCVLINWMLLIPFIVKVGIKLITMIVSIFFNHKFYIVRTRVAIWNLCINTYVYQNDCYD